MKTVFLFLFTIIALQAMPQSSGVFAGFKGTVDFISDAPLELIKAKSAKLSGAINTTDKSFLFSIPMNTFQGFNSELQRSHFNENYVESTKYPKTTFEGKIIEDIDFSKPGTYQIRAKGNLLIHGIKQQRIIKSTLTITKGSLKIKSSFTVPLVDHQIQIPTIVKQKIAEEIFVNIAIELTPKK